MFGQPAGRSFEFQCPTFTEAVNRLLYVVEQGEPFVMLTGQSGTGRSTLLRHVQAECSRFGHSAILVNAAALDENAFLWHLCGALSIVPDADQSRSELLTAIRDELIGRALCHHRTVIILDDLDRSVEHLTCTVQYLTAINEQTNRGVSVIAGSGGNVPAPLQSLSALRVELEPLSDDESRQFTVALLKSLHTDASRVTDDGFRAVFEFGMGLPARLTRLCDIACVALSTDPELMLTSDVLQALTGETLLRRAG